MSLTMTECLRQELPHKDHSGSVLQCPRVVLFNELTNGRIMLKTLLRHFLFIDASGDKNLLTSLANASRPRAPYMIKILFTQHANATNIRIIVAINVIISQHAITNCQILHVELHPLVR